MSSPSKWTGHQSLTPAYGRDYASAKQAVKAFKDGHDWIIHAPSGSTYCSVLNFAVGAIVTLRYRKNNPKEFVVHHVTRTDVGTAEARGLCSGCAMVEEIRRPRYHQLGHPQPGSTAYLLYLRPDIKP